MKRGYQNNFSDKSEAMFDHEGRLRKAYTMLAVIEDILDKPISEATILVAGGSTGIIDSYLSEKSKYVVSLDIDMNAVRYAYDSFRTKRLDFLVCDAMKIAFQENLFDIVICSQVYEHVPDPKRLVSEIYRVLKPGGLCYFAAGNRLAVIEPHYKLPFLSIIPKPLAHLYLRMLKRGNHYYETHLSYWGLQRLTRTFRIMDYSCKMIRHPVKFKIEYMVPQGSMKQKVAVFLCKYFRYLLPGYIWLLQKPEGENMPGNM